MPTKNSISITLAGQTVELNADNSALLRFQAANGRISGLFDADHSYMHSLRLIHSLLDARTRAQYPSPDDLADHIAPTGDPSDGIYRTVFQLVATAGWLPTAEDLRANITYAKSELGHA